MAAAAAVLAGAGLAEGKVRICLIFICCCCCCSVEELDRPDLKSKPMAVGGMGMITTANYEVQWTAVRAGSVKHRRTRKLH
jgi:nucleotidyltransferase/DNA polymerase involved in DNA repair